MTEFEIQELRKKKWRIDGAPLTTLEDSREFIRSVGLCLLYPMRAVLLPSFMGAIAGSIDRVPARHAFEHEGTIRGNELLLRLVRDRDVYQSSFAGEPLLLSADFVPYLYALIGDRAPQKKKHTPPPGTTTEGLSQLARDVFAIIQDDGPIGATSLQEKLGREISSLALERTLLELAGSLRAIRIESDPQKGDVWDALFRWAPDVVKQGVQLSVVEGLSALVTRYLDAVVAASQAQVEEVLGNIVPRSKVREAVNALLSARELSFVSVNGHPMVHATPEPEVRPPFQKRTRTPSLRVAAEPENQGGMLPPKRPERPGAGKGMFDRFKATRPSPPEVAIDKPLVEQKPGDEALPQKATFSKPGFAKPSFASPSFAKASSRKPDLKKRSADGLRSDSDKPRPGKPTFRGKPDFKKRSFGGPRFGKDASGKGSDKPRFGKSTFGARSDKPRFPKPGVGSPESPSLAPDPSGAEAPPRARPAFDKYASKQRGSGKPSFGKPRFGKPDFEKRGSEKRSFGASSFKKPRFGKPAFGKASFGKSGGKSPFAKKRFDRPGLEAPARPDSSPEASGSAGSERPAQQRFDKPSFGKPKFGKAKFGKLRFGKPAFGKSNFGESKFGKTGTAEPGSGKPPFGKSRVEKPKPWKRTAPARSADGRPDAKRSDAGRFTRGPRKPFARDAGRPPGNAGRGRPPSDRGPRPPRAEGE